MILPNCFDVEYLIHIMVFIFRKRAYSSIIMLYRMETSEKGFK